MSSLKDLASLIMVPSLYKDGELHTVKPLGNSILHPDATGNHDGTDGSTPAEGNFTFSRGSNLAATRVDVNGLIEKGRENVLLYSNDFTLGNWSNDAGTCTRTGGQAGYDGSNDAWLITQDTAGYDNIRSLSTGLTSGVSTMSVYAKAGTSSNMHIRIPSDASRVQFNLSTGVATNKGGAIHQGMDDVGGGWYRCYATFNSNVDLVQIYPEFGSSTPVSIYIQDAQLEAGLVATDYIETGASTAQAGILEDMPRLDYSGGASCPALLLEPQRTNLFETSEYFNTSDWSKSSLTIETNKDTSPEGVKNASKIYPSASSSISYLYSIKSGVAATYTISAYVKANGKNVVWLYINSGSANGTIYFDLSDQSKQVVAGSTQTPTGDIESLGNDWYRIKFTTGSGITLNSGSGIGISDAKGSTSVTKNGEDGVLVYGLQIEQGSYPTSYIPTYGASVTRSLDQCELFGMNAAGISTSNNWTYFIDVDNFESGQEAFYLRSTSAELMHLYHQSLGYRNSSNSSSYPASWSWSSYSGNNSQVKMCIRYDGSQLSVFINGSKKSDVIDSSSLNTSFNYPFDQDKFHFAGNSKWDTNQKAFYDTALTDSECIALTTI